MQQERRGQRDGAAHHPQQHRRRHAERAGDRLEDLGQPCRQLGRFGCHLDRGVLDRRIGVDRLPGARGILRRPDEITGTAVVAFVTPKGGVEAGEALVASIVTFRGNDFKTAAMIRQGTAQGFEEQSAATAALRGRVADIDNYNVKATTNVYFDTGKWILSDQAKAELCIAAATAKNTPNALLLVVGYTDSVGDEDFNQELSEKRASRVLAHLQQVCRWKQFRTLTPSGMAESDPVADNSTDEGKAQNRRVAVNVLVSKAVDGL